MKVKLLIKVGTHEAGTILDVDNTIVGDLIKDGTATINLEAKIAESKVVEPIEPIEETNEPVVELKAEPTEETTAKVYADNSGKTYTEEEFLKMDKRTNTYKEIKANLG